jgi:hypothetical protein
MSWAFTIDSSTPTLRGNLNEHPYFIVRNKSDRRNSILNVGLKFYRQLYRIKPRETCQDKSIIAC